MYESGPIARQRRQTLHFLRFVHAAAPVFLDTDVDMTRIRVHRARTETPASYVAYALVAGARVLARHPEANAAIFGTVRPRIARFTGVDAKLALDKTIDGQRSVVTVPIPDTDRKALSEVNATVQRLRDSEVADIPELRGTRLLQRMPFWLGRTVFAGAVRRPAVRRRRLGTFAVSALGHRPVNGFFAPGGTAVTFGLGQVRDAPTIRDGKVTVAPLMRLSLTFDHRVLDGAAGADIISEVKALLEGWQDPDYHAVPPDDGNTRRQAGAP